MKAGRKLDALIAEKVMGWKAKHHSDTCDGVAIIRCGACGRAGHGNCYGQGGGEIQLACLDSPCCEEAMMPAYSSDIAAAWLVVDKLLSMDIGVEVYRMPNQEQWACSLYIKDDDGDYMSRGDSVTDADCAPLAICLAALKAIGHD